MEKLIIAHRGASGYEKENTLKSFEKAIELGADMIEFDVRRTRDGEFIIVHDAEIMSKSISELSWDEVCKFSEDQGFCIPRLEEVLKYLKGRIRLDIELKEQDYELEVLDMVLKYFNEKEFIVTSFNEKSVAIIKTKYRNIKTGLLLGTKNPKNLVRTRLQEICPFFIAKKIKVDYIVPNCKLMKIPFFVRIAQFFNLPIIIWTVNDSQEMKRFLKYENVHGIITDYPDLLKK